MKTIETKMTKSGNITVKVNGERTSIKIAAAILDRAMFVSNTEPAEIVNEAGEKFTYGGREYKNGYTYYYFNNDNGKNFDLHTYKGNLSDIAKDALREIANMPAIEKMNAEYQASQIRLKEIFAINDYAVSPEAQEIAIAAEETAATVGTETAAEINNETVKFFDGKFYSVFSRKYHGAIVKTNGIISYCVFNDGDTEVYDVRGHEVSYDEFMQIMAQRAEHLPDEPQPPTDGKPKSDAEIKNAANDEVTDKQEKTKMENQPITKEHSYVQVVADTTRNGNVKVAIWEYGKGQLKSTVAKVAKEMNQTAKIRITGNDANSYIEVRTYEGSQIDATGEYVFTDVTDCRNKNFGKIYKFANAKDAILKIATGNVEDNFIFTDENLIALAYLNGHQDAIDAAAEAEIELAANTVAEVKADEVDKLNDVDIGDTDETATPSTADEMNTAIGRLVAEFDREQTEADRERKIAEAAAEEMAALESEAMDTHDKLDIKIIENAPKAEIEELAEHIAALDRRYHELHKVKYGHAAEYSPSTAAEIIADAIELLTVIDSDGNEIKPAAAAMFTEPAEVDEPEVTEVTETERKIAEAVADSMTAEAPHGWAVTFTDAGNFEVTAHGLSTATVGTITAGDYLNPKEFFAKFLYTQADIDDEREEMLRRLEDEREQLLHMRDELVAEHPDEVERLKVIDEMIAETDADIAAFESMVKLKPDKPVEFDKKGNVKNLWF